MSIYILTHPFFSPETWAYFLGSRSISVGLLGEEIFGRWTEGNRIQPEPRRENAGMKPELEQEKNIWR